MGKQDSSQEQAKKFRSKRFFRVAVEGDTIDGRKIERQWLQDMADTYSTNTYGSRIWLEHLRGLSPDSPFRAYGDVVALKAEEVDIEGQKKLALFAQLEATADLVAINKKDQKIYTSIEVEPNFAKTGKAYLMGLGITDSPASIGTERLQFSSNLAGFSFGKSKDNYFSVPIETEWEFEEVQDSPSYVSGLFSKISSVFKKQSEKQDVATQQAFGEVEQSLTEIAEHVVEQAGKQDELYSSFQQLKQSHDELLGQFNALQQKLGNEPVGQQRPPVSNSQYSEKVDC